MREAPTWAEPLQTKVAGDDPLGLAPTNERLYNAVFPGFNNYVRYIRVYSALCWTARQIEQTLGKGAWTKGQARALSKAAFEKTELALLWTNPGVQFIAGNTRQFPGNDRPVRMRFEAFGASTATLMDPAAYKPSLTNGLQFLEHNDGIYRCSADFGYTLAQAFDQQAKPLAGYSWFKDPRRESGRRSQVLSMAQALDVLEPSRPEREAFLRSFCPPTLDAHASQDQRNRNCSLELMLRSVQAVCDAHETVGQPASASIAEVRECMARGRADDGASVVTPDTERVQAWWAVLQVRQLQKLAQETLYRAVELWIAEREAGGGERSVEACVAGVAASLRRFAASRQFIDVTPMMALLRERQGQWPTLYEATVQARLAAGPDPTVDVFWHMDRLSGRPSLGLDEERQSLSVANAYAGLVFCAAETNNLSHNRFALSALRQDGDNCSLLRLGSLVDSRRDSTAEAFIAYVLEEWTIARHFHVVLLRSRAFDGKNRFRFVLGDNGLERFDRQAGSLEPSRSNDKLEHALILSHQCGLLAASGRGYRLTTQGRARLSL